MTSNNYLKTDSTEEEEEEEARRWKQSKNNPERGRKEVEPRMSHGSTVII